MKTKTKINKSELKEILIYGIDIAKKAGEILEKRRKKLSLLKISHKEAQGVVSNADVESENFILKSLKKKYPHHEFLAEESSFKNHPENTDLHKIYKKYEYCWAIDPLDGTSNFLNNFDYYAVCLGLMNYGVPVLGIVYRPSTRECYYAISGDGAKYEFPLKGKNNFSISPIKIRPNKKKLKDALLVTGFSTEKGYLQKKEFEQFKKLTTNARGVRRLGSAALDMCLVARGIFDGFWETGLAPWDVAASSVICMEAGIKITDFKGKIFNPFQKNIISARAPIYGEMIKLL